jgi:NAD(P)H dehydrogenase (quinone)
VTLLAITAITGATGAIGGRVARSLQGDLRLVVRDAARAPDVGAEVRVADYGDGAAMRTALDGAQTLFLVSATEHPERVRLHTTAVDAAVAAGVERLVYLSFLNAAPDATFTFARDHWATEQRIRDSGVQWTFLRDATYADFLPALVGPDGAIRGPAGNGAFSPVAQDDVAAVAAAVLSSGAYDGRTLDLTGPELLTMVDVAGLLAELSGRPVRYVEETVEEAYASRASYGAAQFEVDGWVSTYTAIAAGDLAVVSPDVREVLGRDPMSVRELLTSRPELLHRLA